MFNTSLIQIMGKDRDKTRRKNYQQVKNVNAVSSVVLEEKLDIVISLRTCEHEHVRTHKRRRRRSVKH